MIINVPNTLQRQTLNNAFWGVAEKIGIQGLSAVVGIFYDKVVNAFGLWTNCDARYFYRIRFVIIGYRPRTELHLSPKVNK